MPKKNMEKLKNELTDFKSCINLSTCKIQEHKQSNFGGGLGLNLERGVVFYYTILN
jgi:hypothetical protein